MNQEDIYNALDPSWWTLQTSLWNTEYYSCVITFDTAALTGCTYVSSAPYQTNGLNAGTGPYVGYESDLINELRTQASYMLANRAVTSITGHTNLSSVYGATE